MIEDVSKNYLYDKHNFRHFRESVCYICGNSIPPEEEHIIESWQGDKVMVVSRRSHIICSQFAGREIVDIEL